MDWAEIGKRIRALRLRRGWSLRQLGERAQVSHSMIANLEDGTKTRPSLEHVERIATALGVTLRELTAEGGDEGGKFVPEGVEDLQVKLLRIGEIDRELGQDRLAHLAGVIQAVMEQAERDYLRAPAAERKGEGRSAERRRRTTEPSGPSDRET